MKFSVITVILALAAPFAFAQEADEDGVKVFGSETFDPDTGSSSSTVIKESGFGGRGNVVINGIPQRAKWLPRDAEPETWALAESDSEADTDSEVYADSESDADSDADVFAEPETLPEVMPEPDSMPEATPEPSKISRKFKNAFKKLGHGIKKAAKKVGHGIKKAAKKVGHGIKKAAQKVGQVAKKVYEKVAPIAGMLLGKRDAATPLTSSRLFRHQTSVPEE